MATLAPPSSTSSEGVLTVPIAGRTNSGGFKTTDGTLYVSKPFRSKSSKKLRALITFAPRKSHFDTTNESSGTNEFRVSIGALALELARNR
jgi:sterol O-acyltransferase